MSVFETLRERVDLAELAGRYPDMNRSGRAFKGRCPSPEHPDRGPSFYVFPDERFFCFGCRWRGDATDFWAKMHGIDRPMEAALDLAREYDVDLPEQDPDAASKAEERRKHEAGCAREAEGRHEELERHPHVRAWWRSRGFDEGLQERYFLGASADGSAATIPYWYRGRVQGIIERRLEGEPKYLLPNAEDLPDGRKPLFVPGRVRSGTIIVEGFVDGLALDALGESVVAVGGTDPNEAQLRELKRLPGELYILFDADEAGEKAARELARKLYPKGRVCPARYGEGMKDAADLFAAKNEEEALETLEEVKKASEDLVDIEITAAAELEDPRRRLDYAIEHIVPLAGELGSETARDAALDIIVAGRLGGVRAAWLKKALKEEQKRREAEEGRRRAKMLAEAEIEARRRYLAEVEAAAEEIAATFGRPGVLERFRRDTAEVHGVVGDGNAIKLVALVALGAQLEPLPNGRPLGPSVLLTAPPGRGKNHIVDAAVRLLPEEFYVAFEIASAQAFYYVVESDPGYLEHTFVYPNEIEAVDALVEFLRPMLSGGKATKLTVNKDANGANVAQELVVRGPITTAIPTVRNKTDEQLHTRLLVGELPDYEGRVKTHSAAFSGLLLPGYAAADNSGTLFVWHAGLRQLAETRRVVFPLKHPDFALDNDDLSHGARAWANLLGLMCANAWLEQRNRGRMTLAAGKEAIVAEPADYRVAYTIFEATCARTVVNLSEAHRKILDAVHALEGEEPARDGFPQRRVAQKAGVSQSTVSSNKTFLLQSAKLLSETEQGLALVAGAEPSWWKEGDVMSGIPMPEEVQGWWESRPTPPDGAGGADRPDQETDTARNGRAHGENGDRQGADRWPIADRSDEGLVAGPAGGGDRDRGAIGGRPIIADGLGKPNSHDEKGAIGAIARSAGTADGGEERP